MSVNLQNCQVECQGEILEHASVQIKVFEPCHFQRLIELSNDINLTLSIYLWFISRVIHAKMWNVRQKMPKLQIRPFLPNQAFKILLYTWLLIGLTRMSRSGLVTIVILATSICKYESFWKFQFLDAFSFETLSPLWRHRHQRMWNFIAHPLVYVKSLPEDAHLLERPRKS